MVSFISAVLLGVYVIEEIHGFISKAWLELLCVGTIKHKYATTPTKTPVFDYRRLKPTKNSKVLHELRHNPAHKQD